MIKLFVFIFVLTLAVTVQGASLLIPMDDTQADHLKAYGVCFRALDSGTKAEWLLNYRGGSFLIDNSAEISNFCLLMGVTSETMRQSASRSEVSRSSFASGERSYRCVKPRRFSDARFVRDDSGARSVIC